MSSPTCRTASGSRGYNLKNMRSSFIAITVLLLAACSTTEAQPAKTPGPTEVVATVGPTPITLAEVDARALDQPVSNFGNVKLSQALYEARRAAIDELVANVLMERE